MIKNPVNMNLVFKRKMCLEDSRKLSKDCYGYYEAAIHNIKQGRSESIIRSTIDKFFCEMASKETSNKYISKCVDVLSELYKYNHYKILEEYSNFMISEVMPYCENNSTILARMEVKEVSAPVTDKMTEAIKEYALCDRILDNHNKLSKRFKIDNVIRTKYTTLEEICQDVCEMIDTYDMKPHIKMELCFEEVSYITSSYGIPVNEQDMVVAISDYFLSLPMTEGMDIAYANTIKESKILSMEADTKVQYLTNPVNPLQYLVEINSNIIDMSPLYENYGEDKIKELMNQYKVETEKSDSKFKNVLNKIFTQSPQAILEETPDLLKWIRNFMILGTTSKSAVAGIVSFFVNGYMHFDLRKKETERAISYFENELKSVEKQLERTTNPDKEEKLESYIDELNKSIEKLKEYNDSLYSEDEVMNREDDDFNESTYELSEEATKIVLDNLISDTKRADEFIHKLEEDMVKKNDIERTEEKDVLTQESAIRYIDPEGRISMVLCSYDISKCKDQSSIYESLDSIIKATNNMLFHRKGKVYYTMMENCVDIEFRSKFKVITSLKEEENINEQMTDVQLMRAFKIIESADMMEKLYNIEPNTIIDSAIKRIGNLSNEQAQMFVEAWGCGSPIDKNEMGRFVSEYTKYQNECGEYINAYEMKRLFDGIVVNEFTSVEDAVNSTIIMKDIVTEAMDLNSLKMAMMNIKKKVKSLPAKEQQMCRNLDMSFNNFMRGVNNFYKVTDHRDQIIKGQIVPSLSKIIKVGIALAGIGIASGGFVLPAIALVGGLVLSKNSNSKNKQVMIDAIDVELQVVEREIEICKEKGKSSKKYRTLLSTQKALQREKQRIVYNLAKKGKRVPISATAGIGRGGDY